MISAGRSSGATIPGMDSVFKIMSAIGDPVAQLTMWPSTVSGAGRDQE
jgi:hypothetical protein